MHVLKEIHNMKFLFEIFQADFGINSELKLKCMIRFDLLLKFQIFWEGYTNLAHLPLIN